MERAQLRLPNFLIVGAMKAGTSTLADYLSIHSNIHMPENELHFFDNDHNYDQGADWYSRELMKGIENKEVQKLIGEKTPTYSYQENCAERIHNLIPDCKLIWIFRNPVKRTFSNYIHAYKYGVDTGNFHNAIVKEPTRILKNPVFGYAYRSFYHVQIERFQTYYKLENMHFMLFEDLIKNPLQELNKVTDFLGVDHFKEKINLLHSNKSVIPAFPRVMQYADKNFNHQSKLFKLVRRVNYKFQQKKPVIKNETVEILKEKFVEPNKKLTELTGLDLSSWE